MTFTERPITRYVMLFQARAGSTHLTELLASHAEICAAGEKFAERKEKGPAFQTQVMRNFLMQCPHGVTAVGFKTKLKDVADPVLFAAMLREVGAKIIYLGRRNIVKQVVSWFNSQRLFNATGDWNLYSKKDQLNSFQIDPDEFDSWLARYEHGREVLEDYVMSLQLPTLCLYYEDFLIDYAGSANLALSFLGAKRTSLRGECQKNTRDDLHAVIKNFDELTDRFRGTDYEAMFHEVLVPVLSGDERTNS